MDLFLSKLLPIAVYPLGLALLVGLLAWLLGFTRLRRTARTLALLALLGLYVASTPAFANWFGARLEYRVAPVAIEAAPEAEVAVLLGGVLGQPLPPRTEPDLSGAVDRVVTAARLYRAGKVSAILVTAGNIPWLQAVAPEAELIADLLVELGVPREAIILETASRNTYENAVNSAAVMAERGWTTGLLVTSALHMPRSMETFAAADLDLVPFPTDFRTRTNVVHGALDFLPDAGALALTTDAVKEFVGRLVYRIRGWA
ncbi:MAG: YdcF family protein [Bauldia sp.]|nr:YdcF family protein [Bauldia sp.]